MNNTKWFEEHGYSLKHKQIDPVYRNKYVYAVAAPANGGAWLVFKNKSEIESHIKLTEHNGILFSE